MPKLILQRTRFFLAVEGESEQSFVRWLQMRAEERELPIHLDGIPLGGGGFKSMLEKAVREHDKRCKRRAPYRHRFLIVDEDRAGHGEWSIDKLRTEAAKHKITVCFQRPNHEGLLLRMKRGLEHEIPNAASAEAKLRVHWPNYKKPANAHVLERRFSLEDLLRVARVDSDLETLLTTIGLTR